MIRKYSVTLHPGEHAKIGIWGGMKKWKEHTGLAIPEYVRGIKSPRRDWECSSCRAQKNWHDGTIIATHKGSWEKGLKRRGTEGWKERTLQKGPRRFHDGTIIASPQFEAEYAPYRDAIARTKLAPRFPKRDPRNINRVSSICTALGRKKEAITKSEETCQEGR